MGTISKQRGTSVQTDRGELTTENRAESPELCPDISSQKNLTMVSRPPGEEAVAFFFNDVGKTGYPHAK